jgi:hypothetical protein
LHADDFSVELLNGAAFVADLVDCVRAEFVHARGQSVVVEHGGEAPWASVDLQRAPRVLTITARLDAHSTDPRCRIGGGERDAGRVYRIGGEERDLRRIGVEAQIGHCRSAVEIDVARLVSQRQSKAPDPGAWDRDVVQPLEGRADLLPLDAVREIARAVGGGADSILETDNGRPLLLLRSGPVDVKAIARAPVVATDEGESFRRARRGSIDSDLEDLQSSSCLAIPQPLGRWAPRDRNRRAVPRE